jgi:hypothetical protein
MDTKKAAGICGHLATTKSVEAPEPTGKPELEDQVRPK